jgi:hypothetical protein
MSLNEHLKKIKIMKIDLLVKFSVTKEESTQESLDKIQDILVDNEEVNLVYSHVRDKV